MIQFPSSLADRSHVHAVELPSRPPRRRVRSLPSRGPRLPRQRAQGRHLGQRQPLLGRLEPGAEPQARRPRLDRHDLAEAVRRRRALVPRPLHLHRGAARGRRARRRALGRRPPERTALHPLRQRRAEAHLPAADHARRGLLLDRHERARRRLRPGVDPQQGRARRRRLAPDRHQDLDLGRAPQPLDDRAGAHRAPGRRSPRRDEPVPGRSQVVGRPHRPPDHATSPATRASTKW